MPENILQSLCDIFRANPVAQSIGVAGMLLCIFSYQVRSARGIVIIQTAACLFWVTHFLLLGATAGVLLNAPCLVRNFVYAQQGRHRWASHVAWPIGFATLFVALGVYSAFHAPTPEGWRAFLPAAAQTVGCVALRCRNAQNVRIGSAVLSAFWLVYDALSRSIPGVVCEILNQISLHTAIVRYARKRNAPNEVSTP